MTSSPSWIRKQVLLLVSVKYVQTSMSTLFPVSFIVIVTQRVNSIAELEDDRNRMVSQETLDALRLEQNTWGLLQALLPYVFSPLASFRHLRVNTELVRQILDPPPHQAHFCQKTPTLRHQHSHSQ
jgi:hypothetical protein